MKTTKTKPKDGKCVHGFTAILKSGTCVKKAAGKRKTTEATP